MYAILKTLTTLALCLICDLYRVCSAIETASPKGWVGLDMNHQHASQQEPWISQRLINVHQCLRLCWLFKACTSVSFTTAKDRCGLYRDQYTEADSDDSSQVLRLVRDPDSVVVGLRRAKYEKYRIKALSKNRGCDTRPCSESEMCAPVRNKLNYVCLSLATAICSGDPPTVANSERQPDGVSSVSYTCAHYHRRSGTTFISTCDHRTGKWSAVDMQCTFVNCGSPPTVEGTKSTGLSTYYEAEVTYTCLSGGASPSDSMTITCQADAEWTTPPKACGEVSCGSPPVISHSVPKITLRPLTNALPGLTEVQLAVAVGGTVTYKCKPGYESSPMQTYLSECQADGNWSPTGHFLCTPIDCGDPPLLANSHRQGSPFSQTQMASPDSSSTSTTYLSAVFYSCHKGYGFKLSAGSDATGFYLPEVQLQCSESGTWTFYDETKKYSAPDILVPSGCLLVDCGSPSAITGATIEYNSTVADSKAIYNCDEPAVSDIADGSNIILCGTDGQWSRTSVECNVVPCGFPPLAEHSTIAYTIQAGLFQATYTCDQGYTEGSGNVNLICNAETSLWEDHLVTCSRITCSAPSAVDHASVTETGREYLDMATYTCEQGYKLAGDPFKTSLNRTCTEQGTWSSESISCEEVSCPAPPIPDNAGPVSELENVYKYADVVEFKCRPGSVLELSNNSQVTCKETGWESAVSEKEIRCIQVPCGPAPVVINAEPMLHHLETPMVVTYSCLPGHQLSEATVDRKTCINDGDIQDWSRDDVECVLVDCGEPIFNSEGTTAQYGMTTYSNSIEYECKQGHTAVFGNASSTCMEDGRWSGEPLQCQVVDCGPPPDWPNAQNSLNGTSYNSPASYTCKKGYSNATWETTCLSCGRWDPDPFVNCSLVDCGPPSSLNNSAYDINSTVYNSKVTYICEPGYYFFGNASALAPSKVERVCSENGHWQTLGLGPNTPLVCDVPGCPDPPSIDNAAVALTTRPTQTRINSTVTYICKHGYHLVGEKTLTCEEDFDWSYAYFECVEINCGVPLEVQNASMTFSSTTLGSEVTFTCDDGYFPLTDKMQKKCVTPGRWSDTAAICINNETVSCGEPPEISNATRKYTSVTPGAVAFYTCNPGFQHTWLNTYTCMESGFWWSPLVLCEPIDCGEPPAVDLANVTYRSTTYRSTSQYECGSGTRSFFGTTKHCTVNGTWSEDIVECIPDNVESCGQPVGIENSHLLVFNGSVEGSTAMFRCNEGHEGSLFSVTCQGRSWVAPAKTSCRPVDCGAPPTISNTATSHVSGTTFGSVAKYDCLPGYVHTGSSLKICQASKLWSSNLVECVPLGSVSCGDPPRVEIENIELSLSSRLEGNKALYRCDGGYGGSVESTCLRSGRWSNPNVEHCVPVDCGTLTYNPLHIALAVSTTFGSIAAFVCSSGSLPSRPLQAHCMENGEWSVVEGHCTKVNADFQVHCTQRPPDIPNSVLQVSTNHVGSLAEYKCLPGFMPLPTERLTHVCLPTTKQWSDEPIQCEPTACLKIPDVPNTVFITKLNDDLNFRKLKAVFSCVPGYSTDGYVASVAAVAGVTSRTPNRIELECEVTTGWEIPMNVCLPIDCGNPLPVDNAIVKLITGETTYSSEAYYQCSPPFYELGSVNSTNCGQNGLWTDTDFSCGICDQTTSPLPNSTISLLFDDPMVAPISRFSDQARLVCDDWFYFIGDSDLLRCQSVGGQPKWVGSNVRCIQVYWENPEPSQILPSTAYDIPIYSEAVTTKLTVCTNFTYLGNERVVFTLEQRESTSAKATMVFARLTWFDNFSGKQNYMRLRMSEKNSQKWSDIVEKHFDLAVGAMAKFCLVFDVMTKKIQFLHDGHIEMEAETLAEMTHEDVNSARCWFDVKVWEFRVIYE